MKGILLGDVGVGKTTLLSRLLGQPEIPTIPTLQTTIVRIPTPSLPTVSFDLWDTAGQEKYHSLGRSYYRDTQIAILVFDVTRPLTLFHLYPWKEQVKEQHPILVLVGNKTDLPRTISSDLGRSIANDWNGHYVESGRGHPGGSAWLLDVIREGTYRPHQVRPPSLPPSPPRSSCCP